MPGEVLVDEIDLMAPEVQEHWFPHFRALRERAPVGRVPSTREYFRSRYEDVIYVLRRPELFPHTSRSSDCRLLQADAALRSLHVTFDPVPASSNRRLP
jgi:hypothetical protein